MNRRKKPIAENLQEVTLKLPVVNFENEGKENVSYGSSSTIGTRVSQQDACTVRKVEESRLVYAVLCDGMGGMAAGEIASNIAVNFLAKSIEHKVSGENLIEQMIAFTMAADMQINQLTNTAGEPLRSGTTMVMVVIKDGYLRWTSVGDSKIYLIRKQEIFPLTNEHNYLFMAEQRKDDESFEFNPQVRGDSLVSYLGVGELPYIDISEKPLKLKEGDIVVLCSDGLYRSLSEEQIKVMFLSENQDMERAAQMLTTAAAMNAMEEQDNTTVITLKYMKESI